MTWIAWNSLLLYRVVFCFFFILIWHLFERFKKKYIFEQRRVWRYQRDNHNQYIEEEQTTQWPKEKVQKDKRSTKHTYKTKDGVTLFSTKAQYLSPKWQHILGQYTLMFSTESWPVNTHIQLTSSYESRICY